MGPPRTEQGTQQKVVVHLMIKKNSANIMSEWSPNALEIEVYYSDCFISLSDTNNCYNKWNC